MNQDYSLLSEIECYRRILLIGVVLSTSAVISSVIFIPLLFLHLQSLQTSLSHELHFCSTRSHDLWDELKEIERIVGVKSRKRRQNFLPSDPNPITYPYLRRSGGSYQTTTATPPHNSYKDRPQYVDESNSRRHPITVRPIIEERRSSICIFGPPGPPGYPGVSGRPGHDGFPGGPGMPAPDYGIDRLPHMIEVSFCQQCHPAQPGRTGAAGNKGFPGPPGATGLSFFGRPNPPGAIGAHGLPGLPGRSGLMGMAGLPGEICGEEIQYGISGPPGPPGLPGFIGEPGMPGHARYGVRGDLGDPGAPGRPGTPGGKGTTGPIGIMGPRGSCDHCPTPQLAPGYR